MLVKKIVIASIFFGLMTTLALVFRPVPDASAENTLKTFGTIEDVFKAGEDGLVITLEGDDRFYFIDNGLKRGLHFTSLQEELPGKAADIYYVKYWTPMDPLSKVKHISKVNMNSTTLYSAIK